jgi:hypothetical protein
MGILLEIAPKIVLSNSRSRDLTDFNVIPSFKYVGFACVACNRHQTEASHCLARLGALNRNASLHLTCQKGVHSRYISLIGMVKVFLLLSCHHNS